MPKITLSSFLHTFMQSADEAAAKSNLGLDLTLFANGIESWPVGNYNHTAAHHAKLFVASGFTNKVFTIDPDSVTDSPIGTMIGFLRRPGTLGVAIVANTGVQLNGVVADTINLHEGEFCIIVKVAANVWYASTPQSPWWHYGIAASDEDTDLVAATSAVTFRAPYDVYLDNLRCNVNVAPTGAPLIVDINVNGTSILTNKLQIDIGDTTSEDSASPYSFVDAPARDLDENDLVTIDIDQIGSTVAGQGLKVDFLGKHRV